MLCFGAALFHLHCLDAFHALNVNKKNVAILGSVYKLLGEGWDNLLTFSPKFVTH